ncbi:MAG TPA: hypothetical protein VFE06_02535 [Acidobacteriaceae bacterium]|jgi:hypothetical protein|nr:hypothetical protein [Acidobacteriaceae bacterium]
MKILRALAVALVACSVTSALAADEAEVHVQPPHLDTPRPLNDTTRKAVIRDYLESWKVMTTALAENRAGLLEGDFAGAAKDQLTATIQQQEAAGIHTRYQPISHNIQIIFYSPEGLSIQLVDNIEYDVQILDQNKTFTARQVHARYIAVLTPTEVRWRVRLFQAVSE